MVKSPACSRSDESSLPGSQMAAFLLPRSTGCEGGQDRERSSLLLFYEEALSVSHSEDRRSGEEA